MCALTMKIELSVEIMQLFTGHKHISTPARPYIQYV